MRKQIRDELDAVESRIDASTLCWIDTASTHARFTAAAVRRELRRRQLRDRRYPRPTKMQFTAGRDRALVEGVMEFVRLPGGTVYISRIIRQRKEQTNDNASENASAGGIGGTIRD